MILRNCCVKSLKRIGRRTSRDKCKGVSDTSKAVPELTKKKIKKVKGKEILVNSNIWSLDIINWKKGRDEVRIRY